MYFGAREVGTRGRVGMDCRNLSFDVILSYARILVLLYNAGRVRLRPEFTVTQSLLNALECIKQSSNPLD